MPYLWYHVQMLTLTRTTQDIIAKERVLSKAFTQTLPIFTEEDSDSAIENLIQNRVINDTTTWFSTDDYRNKESKFPEGAGKYDYKFVDSPKSEKRIMLLCDYGYNDHFNDEFTRNGHTEFFCGPYDNKKQARKSAKEVLDIFVYEDYCYEHDIEIEEKYAYHQEGMYFLISLVEIDVFVE
jgi:hypothetical protein